MSAAPSPFAERRLLVLAPTGRDGELTRELLVDAGLRVLVCADLPMLA